ncbi:MAG: phage head closure protein [Hyphomicrobiaceae bacterium]|nr:MAG: phage head closure protein [Hyphomicrobiaceae bacterium]
MTIQHATAGRLRRRLSLQEASRVTDAGGGSAESWGTVAILWGEVRPVSGREGASQHQLQGRVSHEIVIRHRPGVAPAMRFVEGERVYEILAVLEHDGRKRILNCLCEERKL